jgi:VanZ family protein
MERSLSSSRRASVSRWRWAVPVTVMAGILAATSWPTPPHMPGSSDKLVHFSAYALLGGTVAWAAEARSMRDVLAWMLLVSALGAADEWHQQFIPGRRMDARDWLADTAGAVSGLSLVTALRRRRESVA